VHCPYQHAQLANVFSLKGNSLTGATVCTERVSTHRSGMLHLAMAHCRIYLLCTVIYGLYPPLAGALAGLAVARIVHSSKKESLTFTAGKRVRTRPEPVGSSLMRPTAR